MKQFENKPCWQTIATPQFLQIITALQDAKTNGRTKMLIGSTGVGKTYAINKFFTKFPDNTYVITVSDVYKLEDIIEELCEKIGLRMYTLTAKMASKSKKFRVDKICEKLIEIKSNGDKPILIFDECENMNMSVLKNIKGLYDKLKDNCSIVLIGTTRLIDRMLNINGKKQGRNRDSLPELYGRFKAGLRYIIPVTVEQFNPFLDKYVSDKALRKFICNTLESYRDLNTHLEPVMQEAFENNKPLTETLYKLYHEINY
ncbi:MAG: ATP-binding protein [Chitinophagaceae bacterium]